MRKPKICELCPLAGDMEGFVPDKLDPEAEVMVITMFPTQWESAKGIPREGISVQEYETQYERYAGTASKSFANVIRCRAQRGVVLPKGAKLSAGIKFCRALDIIPNAVKLVVMVGQDVVRALRPDIKNGARWRGFQLPVSREVEAVSDEDI